MSAPEMIGFEPGHKIRYGAAPKRKNIPLLMPTGWDPEGNFQNGRIPKIDGFIVEPAKAEVLRGHLNKVLGVPWEPSKSGGLGAEPTEQSFRSSTRKPKPCRQ